MFFLSNDTIKIRILEKVPVKPITHTTDLKKMFPDIDIHDMHFVCMEQLFDFGLINWVIFYTGKTLVFFLNFLDAIFSATSFFRCLFVFLDEMSFTH